LKVNQVKRLQDSLEKMEHDYNSVVVRNSKLTLELRELKSQMEEGSKEMVKIRNAFKEISRQN
jgi:regulator of replication initiation timing